jgi:hypothetical protein
MSSANAPGRDNLEVLAFVLLAIATVGAIVIGLFFSAFVLDRQLCTESLASADLARNECDPPSRLQYEETGHHWICRCPK